MTTNVYRYILSFGENIKFSMKEVPALVLEQPDTSILTIDQKKYQHSYKVTLDAVKFNRKIYQPGEIDAKITIKKDSGESEFPSPKNLSEILLLRLIDLSVRKNTVDGSNETKGNIIEQVAKNYYVHEIYPQLTRAGELTVKLKIFSMDKMMTLNKYSQAFVSKKLSDILNDEKGIFGYNTSYLRVNHSSMRKLIYTDNGNKYEYVHPYLVQYNESFFDFMVRTANRCGEFLYFEDGKLNLGLVVRTEPKKDDNGNVIKDGNGNVVMVESDPYTIKDYSKVTYQSVSDSPLSIDDYARDSMKEMISGVDQASTKDYPLSFSPIKKDVAGYPTEVFPSKPSYNSELTTDDYIYFLYKDKFDTLGHEMGLETPEDTFKMLLDFTKKAIATTDGAFMGLAETVKNFAESIILSLKDNGIKSLKANAKGNEKSIDKFKGTETGDGTKAIFFSNAVKDCWKMVNYYHDVRMIETEQLEQTICIDMGTNYASVKLGDKIKVDNMAGTYVIIQIKQLSQGQWNNVYDKYGDDTVARDLYEGVQSQVIYAVPVKKDSDGMELPIMPPLHPVPVVRKSGPQTAFVVDSFDMKHQGRVRIAFPWQSVAQLEKRMLADTAANEKYMWKRIERAKLDLEDARIRRDKTKDLLRYLTQSQDGRTDTLNVLEDAVKQMEIRKAELDEIIRKEGTYVSISEGETTKDTTDESHKADLEIELNQAKKEKDSLDARIEELKKKDSLSDKEKEEKEEKEAQLEIEERRINALTADLKTWENTVADYKQKSAGLETKIQNLNNYLTTLAGEKAAIHADYEQKRAEARKQYTGQDLQDKLSELDVQEEEEWKAKEKEVVEELKKPVEEALAKLNEEIAEKDKAVKELQKDVPQLAAKTADRADQVNTVLKNNATPWVRVATPMATQGGGFYFMPKVGDEVLVNFDNDNVERPYVVGSLYSKNLNDPTYKTTNMAIVSPNGHTISFDNPTDGSKALESIIPAVKWWKNSFGLTYFGMDQNFAAKDEDGKDITYKAEAMKDLTGGIHIFDRFGLYDIEMSSNKRAISISAPMGKVNIDAFQGITVSAPNGDVKIEGKNVTIKAGNNLTLQSGTNIRDDKRKRDAALRLTQEVTKKFLGDVAGFLPFVDLSLIRSLVEVFVRPVEGTMLIKSKKYLKLEAGKGETSVMRDRYNISHQIRLNEEEMCYFLLQATIDAMNTEITKFMGTYTRLWKNASKKGGQYHKTLKKFFEGNDAKKDQTPQIWKLSYDYDVTKNWENDPEEANCIVQVDDYTDYLDDSPVVLNGILYDTRIGKASSLAYTAREYGEAVYNLHKFVLSLHDIKSTVVISDQKKKAFHNEFVKMMGNEAESKAKNKNSKAPDSVLSAARNAAELAAKSKYPNDSFPGSVIIDFSDEIFDEVFINDALKAWNQHQKDHLEDDLMSHASPFDLFFDDHLKLHSKQLKRMFALRMLQELSEDEGCKKYFSVKYLKGKSQGDLKHLCKNDKLWADFVDNMGRTNSEAGRWFYDAFVQSTLDLLKDKFQFDWFKSLVNKDFFLWDDSQGGQILFSDEKNTTIRMKDDKLVPDHESAKYSESFYKSVIKSLK